MSIPLMKACYALTGMNITQKSVLVSLADMANDDGVCWPSIATISGRISGSERAVQEALKWLIESNALQRKSRNGRSNIFIVSPAEYTLAPQQRKQSSKPSVTEPQTGAPTLQVDCVTLAYRAPPDADCAPPDADCAPPPVQATHPESKVNPKLTHINKSVLKPSYSKKPRYSNGTQLPRDWVIPDAWLDDAEELGMHRFQAKKEARRFRNHYHSATGRSSLSNDWHAKWELWVDRGLDNREQCLQRPVSDFIKTHTDPIWRNGLKENFIEIHSNRDWAEGL